MILLHVASLIIPDQYGGTHHVRRQSGDSLTTQTSHMGNVQTGCAVCLHARATCATHTHRVQQVQHLEFPLTSSMYDPLMTHTFDVSSFEHPCHTIVVAAAHERRHGAFTGSGVNYEMSEVYAPILSIRLMMDGREIQYEQQGSFFRQSSIFASKRLASAGVYILQFGVDPENGTVNLSKFSSIQLSIRLKKPVQNSNMDDTEGINVTSCTTLHVFALNFNWLEYKDGQAGLMFA
jgi:hypothetical protein